MNETEEDSCLNFNAHHSLDKSSSGQPDPRLFHSDEPNVFYYKILNESKKGGELESASSPYQSYAKEIHTLKSRIEGLTKERNGLRQQCRAAIQQWEKTLRENNEAKDQLVQLQHQRDEAQKKYNLELSQRLKTAKDLARLTQERNSAVQEYTQVMSERDIVHKEMEKQSEELQQYQRKLKSLDVEKKNLLESIDLLKNEIKSNQIKSQEKEFVIKQMMYKEKYSNETQFSANGFPYGPRSVDGSANRWGSSSFGFSSWTQYGNLKTPISLSSTNSNINSIQMFSPINAKPFSVSNSSSVSTMGNHKAELSDNELELRKQIQALEFECSKINFSFDQCKLQNEKALQERESIKSLCDKLRRERDRAIRDRAEAIQDLNDYKQKIESNAQIKKYMDDLNDSQMNSQMGSQMSSQMGSLSVDSKGGKPANNASSSKDSAISADIQEDYESMSILLVNNFRHNSSCFKNPWGFSVTLRAQEKSIVVSGINLDSPAEEKLKLNDLILSINSIAVNDEQLCNDLLSKFDKELQLVVQRRRQLSSIVNISLDCGKNEHGIVAENVFLIKKLLPDSVAAKTHGLSVGDRLLSINGHQLENSTIHEVMQLLRENSLLLKVYKPSSFSGNPNHHSSSSVLLAGLYEQPNEPVPNGGKLLGKIYQKDDLNLTASGNKPQQSNYSPNIGHYQSIKRSSKKSKVLLNDSSSSFQGEIESDHFSPSLLDKAYNKLFKKSIKSKSEKKEEKSKKSSPEKETLDDFNKILNNLSERDSKKRLFSSGKSSAGKDKNNGGTWPSCKSHASLLASPTYGKAANPLSSTIYSKKKERKSLAIFTNYKNDAKEERRLSAADSKSAGNYKQQQHFNDQYGVITGSNKIQPASSRVHTPVLESSFKSPMHHLQQANKHNERSLSSSISSYSSKENYYKSNNCKKYTINHDDVIYKSFNAPSSSSMEQKYQRKSKDEKFLADYFKAAEKNRLISEPVPFSVGTFEPHHHPQVVETDGHDKKDLILRNPNASLGLYPITTNRRQLITSNYTQEHCYPAEQEGSADNEHSSYFLPSNIDSLVNYPNKKSSPINIEQLKALNRSSLTSSSPSYHLNEQQLFSNSPSSHYATFSPPSGQSNKENYYANSSGKPHGYERPNLPSGHSSSTYGYLGQHQPPPTSPTSPLHQSSNAVESFSSLSSNIHYQPDEFLNKNHNQRFYISSNNSVASKLSNCSMDSNSLLHSNAINQSSSSNYFKKAGTNESLDSASYSNIQNLRGHVDWLNRQKNSLDKKLISASSRKQPSTADKEPKPPSNGKLKEPTIESNSLDNYTGNDAQTKPGEIRQICIEKSKEKELGIQIEAGKASKSSPGIFISKVNEGSIANRVGLKVGDQLLEICGINMRSANKEAAANVLRQCGQTVTMKVQYNPDKFFSNGSPISQTPVCSQSDCETNEKIERETNLDKSNEDEPQYRRSMKESDRFKETDRYKENERYTDGERYKNDERYTNGAAHHFKDTHYKGDDDDLKEKEDTLKDFKINSPTMKDSNLDKEDSYSEKCLYF